MDPARLSALLQAEVCFVCLLISVLLLYWMRRTQMLSTGERWLRRVLLAFSFSFLASCAFGLTAAGLIPAPDGALVPELLKALHLAAFDLGVLAWCGCAEAEQGSSLFEDRKLRPVLCLLAGLPLAAVLTNPWTHLLFRLEGGGIVRHALLHVHMAWIIGWMAVISFRLLRQCRRESDPARISHLRICAVFPLLILAAWLLSIAVPELPLLCVSVLAELLSLYMGATQQMISKDKLTQVNNRQNMLGFLNYKLKNHAGGLYLMMIDVDDFKGINNTWGHLEGDNALIQMAGALKQCCAPIAKRPYIARYGGDEFIVVTEGSREETERLAESIHAYLREHSSPDHPYTLRASIGLIEWREGMSAKELIAAADERMYDTKRKHHAG